MMRKERERERSQDKRCDEKRWKINTSNIKGRSDENWLDTNLVMHEYG